LLTPKKAGGPRRSCRFYHRCSPDRTKFRNIESFPVNPLPAAPLSFPFFNRGPNDIPLWKSVNGFLYSLLSSRFKVVAFEFSDLSDPPLFVALYSPLLFLVAPFFSSFILFRAINFRRRDDSLYLNTFPYGYRSVIRVTESDLARRLRFSFSLPPPDPSPPPRLSFFSDAPMLYPHQKTASTPAQKSLVTPFSF